MLPPGPSPPPTRAARSRCIRSTVTGPGAGVGIERCWYAEAFFCSEAWHPSLGLVSRDLNPHVPEDRVGPYVHDSGRDDRRIPGWTARRLM